jgi:hypothetical protein
MCSLGENVILDYLHKIGSHCERQKQLVNVNDKTSKLEMPFSTFYRKYDIS